MRVIIANDFASINGGADQIAIASARGIAERGHHVTFFASVGPVDAPMLDHPNIAVECLGQEDILRDPNRLRASWRGLWNAAAARAFDRLLATANPCETVVHVHSWTKALTASIFPRAKARGFATIVTLHDYFCACPNGGFYDFPAEQICHRTPLGVACTFRQCDRRSYGHKLWRVLRQHVQRRWGLFPSSLRHAIVISSLSGKVLRPFLPAGIRIHRIGNPIDSIRQPSVNASENRHFTFVGRFAREKAPQHLANAAARLGVRARFVGDGELRDEIASICPSAEITGWQTPKQVRAHLRSARALVFPSVWYETQGLVVGEAAALGVPAIVSHSSAAVEFVVDGETGLIFRTGDVRDLEEKLHRMSDDALVLRLGEAAYERHWANPQTNGCYAVKLEQAYIEMLSEATREVRQS